MKAIHIDDLPLGGWFRYAERGPESEVFVLLDRFGPQSVAEVNPTNARMQAVYSFGNRDNFVLPVQMTEVKDPVGESIPPSPGGPLESALKDARWRIANLLQGQTPQQTDIDMLNRLDFLVNSGHAMSADGMVQANADKINGKATSRQDGWRVLFAKDVGKLTVLSPDGAAVVLHMDSPYKGTIDTLEKFINGFAGLADIRFDNIDEFVAWLGRLHGMDDSGAVFGEPWPPAETAAEAIQARHMDGVVPVWMHQLAHSALAMRMQQLLTIQGADGTWNADPYMLGMYNGMELMLSMVEGRDPSFREPPTRGAPTTDELAEFDLHNTADAKIWADAFCKINRAADHGVMHTWFANAIMTGWDHALKQEGQTTMAGEAESEPACRWPSCLPEAEQDKLADEVMRSMTGEGAAPTDAPAAGRSDDVNEMRLTLIGQIHELVDVAERSARRAHKQGDTDERDLIEGAIAYARKVSAPYNYNGTYRPSHAPHATLAASRDAESATSDALRTPEQPGTDGATQAREHGPENKESADRREDGGTGTDEEDQG